MPLANFAIPCLSSSSSIPTRVSAFVPATAMAPQLDATQRILVETLLAQGFVTRLIALNASCTTRTVQRIRLERQQSESPPRRTARIGRRSCMTSTMRKALCTRWSNSRTCIDARWQTSSFKNSGEGYRNDPSFRPCDPWAGREKRSVALHNNGMLTFEITSYVGYHSTYKSYQLIVDESGCDRREGYRRWG